MEKTEILMKLISLANNNPNEHEANAAARKVCVMLEEMKVNFIPRKTIAQTQQAPPVYGQTRRPNPFVDDDLFNILKNMHRQQNARYYERDPFTNSNPFRQAEPEKPQPKKPKVTRECADCGKPQMTRCESVFYCNTCQWRRYQENKAKQSHA